MLKNTRFEDGWDGSHVCHVFPVEGEGMLSERGNIFVPPGWMFWFVHDEGVWDQPEAHDVHKADFAYRVHEGKQAFTWFTFARKNWAGLYQQVAGIKPGTRLKFSMWAHAWSNHFDADKAEEFPRPHHPHWSEGAGFEHYFALEGAVTGDKIRNFTFRVGIDPTGGTDPRAETVVWGPGAHIYNAYHRVPSVEAVAEASTITVFFEDRTLWPFVHNDVYVDMAELVVVGEPPPTEGAVVPYGGKACTHSIYADGVPDLCRRLVQAGTHLPLVMIVDDMGYVAEIKGISPETRVVARFTGGVDEGLGRVVVDAGYPLDVAARDLMAPIFEAIRRNPVLKDLVDWWQTSNEPAGGGVDVAAHVRIAEVMKICMDLAEDAGIRVGTFAWNAGQPEWDAMVAVCETGVFRQAVDGGHLHTFHEGLLPSDGQDPSDLPIDHAWGDLIPGAPLVPPRGGAFVGRYNYFTLAMDMTGQPRPMTAFLEFYYGGGYGEKESAQEIVEGRVEWCDEHVYRPDPRVLGHCGFTWGPNTPQWERQDYEFINYELIRYLDRVKGEKNPGGDGGVEPPPADSIEGLPRVAYRRVYVCMDPVYVTGPQRHEITAHFWDQGKMFTMGVSWDDAMAHAGLADVEGMVDVTCIAVNVPIERRADFEAFRDEHYPRTKLEFLDWPGPPEPPATDVALGIHDEGGGWWTSAQSFEAGCTVIPAIVRTSPVDFDFRHLHDSAVDMFVVARLNWGWARQDGTMPPEEHLEAHVEAIVETIRRNQERGVNGWVLWNEINNDSEWPPEQQLTPEYVIRAYNMVYDQVGDVALIAPPPVDPYFGPGSDNRVWNTQILNGIHGAGFLVSHAGKSQLNDPASIRRDDMFGPPLGWQFQNSKTLWTWMDQVPERFRGLGVMLGEANPQFLHTQGGETGWMPGNGAWVEEFRRFVDEWNGTGGQQVRWVCFYRWAHDEWAIGGDEEILRAVGREG